MANLRADNLTGTGGRNAIDGSVSFDGDHLLVSTSTDFDYGSNDFTIEFWWRRNTTERVALFHGSWGADWSIGIDYNGAANNQKLGFWASSNGTSWDMLIADAGGNGISTGTPDLNSWSHIAYVRYGNIFRGYLNGIEIVEVSSSSSIHSKTTTSQPAIGAWFNSESAMSDLHGYLSNFRIVKGSALYTANFTPPTEKLTAIDGTVLLCCQDSDDPTQEASGTGKTITGFKNLDITQAEKINGRFSGDPASNGWTVHSGASASYANGQWTVTSPAQIWSGASTSFTSIIGQQYRFTGLVVTSNNWGSISVSGVGGQSASKITYSGWSGGGPFPITINKIFTATSTTTYVSIDNLNTTNTTATTVQYLSVKPVEVGKAPKVLPPVGVDEGVVFDGDIKMNSQGVMYFPTGTTEERGRSSRGVFGGGYKSPYATADNLNSLEYFNIQSTGNAVDFGDRTVVMSQGLATVASSTRGVMMGGRGYNYPASPTNTSTDTIDYVTIATTANAIDFGNLVQGATYVSAAGGNSTRGVLFRQSDADMEYITIATTGNSVDTGSDSTVGRNTFSGSASQTRAFWAGGANPSGGAAIATIDYLEIASLGVPQDFGDLTFTGHNQAASSNTRGIIFTGGFPSAASNTINYITIASTGNASDFGDLPANITSHSSGSGCSNSIRAVRCGGYLAPTSINRIDYVSIQSTGNAQDFGDLITIRHAASGFSDSHGGLS